MVPEMEPRVLCMLSKLVQLSHIYESSVRKVRRSLKTLQGRPSVMALLGLDLTTSRIN